MTERRFNGRVAVITGSGRALGRAYAELLGGLGAKVVVNDISATLAGEGVDVGPAIRDMERQWAFHPAEAGYFEHMTRSFEMARKG